MDAYVAELSRLLGQTVTLASSERQHDGEFVTHTSVTTYPPYRRRESNDQLYSETTYEHRYRPLKAGEIRLLVLNPGSAHEPIQCYLEHHFARKSKPFVALSYTWDISGGNDTVTVDGCSFSVTRNLKNFLASFRSEYDPAVLWIDAVCINQADVAERSAQVRYMKQVYEEANSIVVWLGNATQSTSAAFNAISNMYNLVRQAKLDISLTAPEQSKTSLTTQQAKQLIESITVAYPGCWSGITDIFKRSWWSRCWVFQEATAPAEGGHDVRCGPHSIALTKLMHFSAFMRYLAFRYDGLEKFQQFGGLTATNMNIYTQLRAEHLRHGKSNFLKMHDLLPTLRGAGATDPRDQLYSLIPISLDGADLLEVDYSQAVEDVYINAAASFIRKDKSLDILGHCTHGRKSLLQLPSWVPDWSMRAACEPFLKRGCDTAPELYQAQDYRKLYDASGAYPGYATFDGSLRKMFCRGFAYDVVKSVSPSFGESRDHTKVAAEWRKWLESIPSVTLPDANTLSKILVADCYRPTLNVGMRGSSLDDIVGSNSPRAQPTEPGQKSLPAGTSIITQNTGSFTATLQRRLFVTGKGHIGLTAKQVEEGNTIAILIGGQLPFVLKSVSEYYTLVGEAYIEGIMDGEAMKSEEARALKQFDIR